MDRPSAVIFSSFFFLFVGHGVMLPQEAALKLIPEVTVVQQNKSFFSEDQTLRTISQDMVRMNPHEDLGYLLETLTPALVKSYGSTGSLSSVSLHGTGSNHTQVCWNGFPLNSPTTGQVDLALIPSGFMQSVDLVNGASGALFGSGTFGGSIDLINEPDWNNRIMADYSLYMGSYGSLGHLLNFRTGSRKVQYHLSAISQHAENDFPYRDYYRYNSPETRRQHNAYRTAGLIQNLYLNLDNGYSLEAGFWYQKKYLEIPALMGSYKESNARQKDSLFRSFMSLRKLSRKSSWVIKTAYFSDDLDYTDKINLTDSANSINSRISTGRWLNETDYRYYFSNRIVVGVGAVYNRITGNSVNYGGKIAENEYAVVGSLKINLSRLIFNAGLRKEFYEGLNPGMQYSFGLRYKPMEKLVIRAGFSSKFRKPTFNEKYWRPGGNPLLQPEKGKGGDITVEWSSKTGRQSQGWLSARVTGYSQWIDNWIQWVIRDSLTPVEYKKVNARGVETLLEYRHAINHFKFNGLIAYNYTRSVITETYLHQENYEGNQLMYVPLHSFRAQISSVYKLLRIGFSPAYTGYRETVETADESLRLPGYWVFNLSAGYQQHYRNMRLDLSFRVDNLLDKPYEIIRSYPVPGRTYHFTITIGLEKSDPEI